MRALSLTGWWTGRVWVCVLMTVGMASVGCGKKSEEKKEEAPAEAAPAEAPAPEPKAGEKAPAAKAAGEGTGAGPLPVDLENVLHAEGVKATLTGNGEMTLKLTVTNQREQTLRIKLHGVLVVHPDPQYFVLQATVKAPKKKKKEKGAGGLVLAVKPKGTESFVFEDVKVVRPDPRGGPGGMHGMPQPMDPAQFGPDGQPLPPGQAKKKKVAIPGVLDELAPSQQFFGCARVPKAKKKKRRSGGGPGGVPMEFGPGGGMPGGQERDPQKQMIKEYVELRKRDWDSRIGDLRARIRAHDAVRLAALLREILDTPVEAAKDGQDEDDDDKPAKKGKKKSSTLADNGYLAAEARLRLVRAATASYPRGLTWAEDKGAENRLNRSALTTSWKLVTDGDLGWALDRRWQRRQASHIQQLLSQKIASLTDAKLREMSRAVGPDRFVHMMVRCRQLQQIHAVVVGKDEPSLVAFSDELDRYFPDCFLRWARTAMREGQYGAVAALGRQGAALMASAEGKVRITKTVATAQKEQQAKALYDGAVAKVKANRHNDALGGLEKVIAMGQTDHLAKAKDTYRDVMDQAEKVAEKTYNRAREKQLKWYPKEAHALYKRVWQELPKTRTAQRAKANMKYLEENFLNKAKALLKKAEAALAEEEFENLRKYLRELSVLGKDLPEREQIPALQKQMKERITSLARKLLSKARQAELLKRYSQAIKWYKRVLAMDPHGEYSLRAQQKIDYLKGQVNE